MKQITITDVRPISLTIGRSDEGNISLSVRYARLDENGDPIEGFVGVLSTDLEGTVKSQVVDFVQNKIMPWIRERESI